MKLSFNWLNEFIDLSDVKIADLADLLTMKTCEVEGYTEVRPELQNFFVSEVKSVEKHPDADKLKICQVFDGKSTVQIVTGAPNVQQGKKYPMAPVGVTMPGGLEIKPAKLRGVESNGMLCSAGELELESFVISLKGHEDGLMTLPDHLKAGESISDAFFLNDFIIEIDNKSITHRPDLWGHYGFAREISALTGKPLKDPEISIEKYLDNSIKHDIDCKIHDKSAIAYSSAIVTSVNVAPSPLDVQARLYIAGMRPINNIVDISNWVMLEMGQPNHTFDRNSIKGPIGISYSKQDEELELLDGREIKTPENLVLIKDANEPVALGGVIGGKTTEVSEKTTTLFLESATFHRPDIRKAVSALGIRTEASQRFEKGQSPENSELGIKRLVYLFGKYMPEIKVSEIHSVYSEDFRKNKIKTTFDFIKEKLGKPDLTEEKILSILKSLSMKTQIDGDNIEIEIPVYRSYYDITIPEDIVEEVGRIIGYNQVKPEPIFVPCKVPDFFNHMRELEHDLKKKMSFSYQFSEVYNYAFHSQNDLDLDKRYSDTAVRLMNPIHNDLPFMRVSPLPGLLRNISDNFKEYDELRFFEVERIFIPKEGKKDEKSLPQERYFLAGIYHSIESDDVKISTIQSLLADLLSSVGISFYEQTREELKEDIFHPGRAGQIMFQKKSVARWGELHPEISNKFKLGRILYFEIFLEDLLDTFSDKLNSNYQPVVKYPGSEFEFTVLMEKKEPFKNLLKITGLPERKSSDTTSLESVEHLTTYIGESIPEDKKAVSVKVEWRNKTRTIQHEELKTLQDNLINSLNKSGYVLR